MQGHNLDAFSSGIALDYPGDKIFFYTLTNFVRNDYVISIISCTCFARFAYIVVVISKHCRWRSILHSTHFDFTNTLNSQPQKFPTSHVLIYVLWLDERTNWLKDRRMDGHTILLRFVYIGLYVRSPVCCTYFCNIFSASGPRWSHQVSGISLVLVLLTFRHLISNLYVSLFSLFFQRSFFSILSYASN